MTASTFDLFKLGVGPSSSHTMGPMVAAGRFVDALGARRAEAARVTVTLYGSLALTGRGHATDTALIKGLMGFSPATLDPDAAEAALAEARAKKALALGGVGAAIGFDEARDILWEGRTRLPRHPNALRFEAFDAAGATLHAATFYSVGGGFVIGEEESANDPDAGRPPIPFPFTSAADLLDMADGAGLSIAALMRANEAALSHAAEVDARLDAIAAAMSACVERGMRQHGELPGGLRVRRRAATILKGIQERQGRELPDPLAAMDWVNLWAIAVNEENAAGGRVVTAPTNGAAGIVPAVLRFYERFHAGTAEGRRAFLLTAGAIGALYKRNASISGAEVGCQGEVGVACSMAAGGLAAALGGTNAQIENAAEIGMEHNLGLTCDPIGGLVQIPCIERNAMGAIKAIDAAKLALMGDGVHFVSLDKVIATMRRTGADMSEIYKETSLGGLAAELGLGVDKVEC
jgi:L-serine dehydratase